MKPKHLGQWKIERRHEASRDYPGGRLAPCSNAEFLTEYLKRHRAKFGEDFRA